MMKYEIKAKIGKTIIFHKILEFTEEEHQSLTRKIIDDDFTSIGVIGDFEDVAIKHKGEEWFRDEFFSNSPEISRLYQLEMEEIAEKYPRILVAGSLQTMCFETFHSDHEFPSLCKKEEMIINITHEFSCSCSILE